MPDLTVEAVNLSQRLALLSDGCLREITNMFDDAGEPTEDPLLTRSCVIKNHETSWFAVLVSGFNRVTLQ